MKHITVSDSDFAWLSVHGIRFCSSPEILDDNDIVCIDNNSKSNNSLAHIVARTVKKHPIMPLYKFRVLEMFDKNMNKVVCNSQQYGFFEGEESNFTKDNIFKIDIKNI